MKVVLINNLFPPLARGGAEVVVKRLALELKKQGHEVIVITTKQARGKVEEQVDFPVYRFYPPNLYHTLNDYKYPSIVRLVWHIVDTFNILSAFKIRKWLKRIEPDVVLTHNLKGIGLMTPWAIKSLKLKWIHTVHDVQLVEPSGLMIMGQEKKVNSLGNKFYTFFTRTLFGSPDKVVSPSHFLLDLYQEHGLFKNSEQVLLPNPLPDFPNIVRNERPSGNLRVLFLGQLEQHKGITFLIEGMKHFQESYTLYVGGTGKLDKYVEKSAQAKPNIHRLGYIGTEQIRSLLGLVDVLVVPSMCYENSPTVIYEALSAGVPVIAAKIGGIGELIEEGKNGYLFTPGNEAEFLSKLQELSLKKEEFFNRSAEISAGVEKYKIERYAERLMNK